jgi:drug/metabolite transporter (DMT)-like permease
MKTSLVSLLFIVGILLLAAGGAMGLAPESFTPDAWESETLFSSGMLMYWAFVFLIASRDPGWTRVPTRQRDARFLAIGLGALAGVYALVYLGLFG